MAEYDFDAIEQATADARTGRAIKPGGADVLVTSQ